MAHSSSDIQCLFELYAQGFIDTKDWRIPAEGSLYVHIWNFNRAISRSERSDNIHDCNSPDLLIRRPGRLAQSCFDNDDGDIFTNHSYTFAVCPMGFSTSGFDRFCLEQDRLILIWARPGPVVVSPSPIGVGSDVGLVADEANFSLSIGYKVAKL